MSKNTVCVAGSKQGASVYIIFKCGSACRYGKRLPWLIYRIRKRGRMYINMLGIYSVESYSTSVYLAVLCKE